MQYGAAYLPAIWTWPSWVRFPKSPPKPFAMKIIRKRMGKNFFYSGIVIELITIALIVIQWVLLKEVWPTMILGALIVPSVFIYVRRSTYPLTKESLPGERVSCIIAESSDLIHYGVVRNIDSFNAFVLIEDDLYTVPLSYQLHNK